MGYIRDGFYCSETKEKDRTKDNEICMGGDMDREKGVYVCVESNEKCRKKESECCCKRLKPKKILLECGCNSQDAIFETKKGHVCDNQAFVLDTVRIDTTHLCRPLVKIEFSSIVYFEAEAKSDCYGGPRTAAVTDIQQLAQVPAKSDLSVGEKELKVDLLFELIRNCKGEKEFVQSWRYIKEYEIEQDDELEVKVSEPFTVTFCDKSCPECCEYKMIVRGKKFEGEIKALRVTKPDLSALAQGEFDD